MRRTWRIVRLASAKLPASGLSDTTAAGGRLMPQFATEKSLKWRFQVRPRALGERTAPHRGAGDAWRAHQAFQRVRVLCLEAKGLESLGVGHSPGPGPCNRRALAGTRCQSSVGTSQHHRGSCSRISRIARICSSSRSVYTARSYRNETHACISAREALSISQS
jgi:hypothetical protein